ncbi:hypothetical protein BIWAKO_00700 [Bosea sp. BIWAKO-01]|nr:hypothetical protein BIWAKO_00700 [Bosea sp. BIWAKO-01]
MATSEQHICHAARRAGNPASRYYAQRSGICPIPRQICNT